jgi:hypothetical protein
VPALARCLCSAPTILLPDEPTEGILILQTGVIKREVPTEVTRDRSLIDAFVGMTGAATAILFSLAKPGALRWMPPRSTRPTSPGC